MYLVIGKIIIKWEESMTNSCFETTERIYCLLILLRSNPFNCDLYPFLSIVNIFKYSISVLINVIIIS